MEINDPETHREVEAVFGRYEAALQACDLATLDAMFLPSARTIRYGVGENLHGIEEIRAYRKKQSPFTRRLERTIITTYGRDFATASTLFHRPDFAGKVGRQMQTWVKMDGQWRIVAAHVSLIDQPQ